MIRRTVAAAALLAIFTAPSYAATTHPGANATTTVTPLAHPSIVAAVEMAKQKYPALVAWHSGVNWATLTHAQKVQYVEGYFDGLATARAIGIMSGEPHDSAESLSRMRAGLQANLNAVIRLLDQGFAKYPHDNAAVLAGLMIYMMMPTEERSTGSGPTATPKH